MNRISIIFLGFIMVLFLAACNSNNTSTGSSDDGLSVNETNGDNGEEQITLRMAWWGEQTRHEYTNKVIEMYEEQHPNINIEPEYASWDDYWKKLAPQAAANELPDIIQMDLIYLTQYAKNKQLTDLTPYIGNELNVDNIADNVVSGGELNDSLYGFNLGTVAMSWDYDPAILEEIGVNSIPENWTWDDYMDIAKKAKDAGYYIDGGLWEDPFRYYLRSKGERLFAEDGKGLGYSDDQLFVDYWTMAKELVDMGAVQSPDELAQQSGPEDSAQAKGEAAGVFEWATMFIGTQKVVDRPMELSPPPGPNVDKGLYLKPSMFFSVSENSEHKKAAAEFIDFFVNDIEANKLILGDRGVPASSKVKEALMDHVSESQGKVFEYMSWVEQNSSTLGAPDPEKSGQVIESLVNIADQIKYGEITPTEGAETFRNQAESILKN
ncbi:sugar ABC transporter substrate-binding protein [Salipaludibacillus neizhouensis]|uniref:Sugar ABC transporter substrate-binding protein n=1 Tax=Salipaludibacillus neizhouensis TaxID=885475 RepID=A0A3A9K450_9BACI|nr:ABC transporter substrate-binding protein [Salipaludibacillus neizhouensis]RKL65071.1 sugar ABC transporter substrate-binding protein [Salipaludibacillus neizhouensis]